MIPLDFFSYEAIYKLPNTVIAVKDVFAFILEELATLQTLFVQVLLEPLLISIKEKKHATLIGSIKYNQFQKE